VQCDRRYFVAYTVHCLSHSVLRGLPQSCLNSRRCNVNFDGDMTAWIAAHNHNDPLLQSSSSSWVRHDDDLYREQTVWQWVCVSERTDGWLASTQRPTRENPDQSRTPSVFKLRLRTLVSSRLRNNLYCVGWGVKLYSLTHSRKTQNKNKHWRRPECPRWIKLITKPVKLVKS